MKTHEQQRKLFIEWIEDTNIPIEWYTEEILELMYSAYSQGKDDKMADIF